MSRIVRSVAARCGLLLAIVVCGTDWLASATADDAAKPAGKSAAVKKKNAARAASTAGQSGAGAAAADKSTATDKPAPADSAPAGSTSASKGAAEPIESAWSARVHAALRRESSAKGAAQDEAVRDLVKLYESLKTAKGIDPDERAELGGLVRNRLARSSERISKRLDKASKKSAAAEANELVTSAGAAGEKPAASGSAAAGQSSAAGQGGAQGPPDYGPQLVELIQHTIAPSTWDVNGGNGTIIYFAPRQAIVVRQTAEVHGDLESVIRGLRDAN